MKFLDNYKLPFKGMFKVSFYDENMNLIKEFAEQNLIVASARNIMPLLMYNTCDPSNKVGMIELGWGGHIIDPSNPTVPIPNPPKIDDTNVYKSFLGWNENNQFPVRFRVGDNTTPSDRSGLGVVDVATDDSSRNIEYFVDNNRITYQIKLTKNDTQLNGKYISECGLFTMHGWDNDNQVEVAGDIDNKIMFAHKCFGGFQKTSDFIVVMSWQIIF